MIIKIPRIKYNLFCFKNFSSLSDKGIGFGLGDVTLTDFLETHGLMPDLSHAPTDILITFQNDDVYNYALKANHLLREKLDVKAEFHPMSVKPKKAFQIAEKKGIKHIIFIGDQELANQTLSFKNLTTKETSDIQLDSIENLRI